MRSFSVSVVAVVALILLTTSNCRASVPKSMGGNHFSVGDANMEFEFMMDSEFSRMLAGSTPIIGSKPLNRPPVLDNCKDSKHYCLPSRNCPTYRRDCLR
ncbi:hypothetical protein P3X46_007964 [Hevea brasiliensis]|uniref:Uncharacterized protein n=1 Tax=Hevea brasiliensis TaxID=3981 RepID=A0ABQ9MV75_HEVBR|nr:hypothetical protein P3X46_007964 [Hevea brasiliensis]